MNKTLNRTCHNNKKIAQVINKTTEKLQISKYEWWNLKIQKRKLFQS